MRINSSRLGKRRDSDGTWSLQLCLRYKTSVVNRPRTIYVLLTCLHSISTTLIMYFGLTVSSSKRFTRIGVWYCLGQSLYYTSGPIFIVGPFFRGTQKLELFHVSFKVPVLVLPLVSSCHFLSRSALSVSSDSLVSLSLIVKERSFCFKICTKNYKIL